MGDYSVAWSTHVEIEAAPQVSNVPPPSILPWKIRNRVNDQRFWAISKYSPVQHPTSLVCVFSFSLFQAPSCSWGVEPVWPWRSRATWPWVLSERAHEQMGQCLITGWARQRESLFPWDYISTNYLPKVSWVQDGFIPPSQTDSPLWLRICILSLPKIQHQSGGGRGINYLGGAQCCNLPECEAAASW